jgi:2-dehydro-3-deoxyphosphogluconate aldolase/(4S)-4-hydroxy-2-oxoglutarate aldolase
MAKPSEHPSIIVSLDIDDFLFDKLQELVEAQFYTVELNSIDQNLLSSALHHFPMLRIGTGNILTTQHLEDCHKAGAHFITSPGFLPSITQTANLYSINYLPGVATLSEAMQASALGCQHVRPFPANLEFCTLVNKYLPLLRLFPAEVNTDEVELFLKLPAVAAVSIANPSIEDIKHLNKKILA